MTEEQLCKQYVEISKELHALKALKQKVKHGPTIPLSDFDILKEKIKEIEQVRSGYFKQFLQLPEIALLWEASKTGNFDPDKLSSAVKEIIKKHTGEDPATATFDKN
jgi:hypothetical protein